MHSEELYAHGADAVMPETIEASLQLASMVLEKVDIDEDIISKCLDKIRDSDYKQINAS